MGGVVNGGNLTNAVNGPGFHTVIAPLFLGDDGNYSFIRIANLNATAVDTTVMLVGSPTGRVYATGTLTSPQRSSPQWSLAQVYDALNVTYGLLAGDTTVALYLSNGNQPLTGFQHVIYNGTNGFFENASVCAFTAAGNYTAFGARSVSNVHTSRLPTYPSTVYLHNRSSNTIIFTLTVSDSHTGALIGILPFSAAGNATYAVPESFLETQLAFHPAVAQQHLSIIVNQGDPLTPDIVLAHFIVNQTFNAYVNMSTFCSIDY